MKKIILLLALSYFSFIKAQAPDLQWKKCLGGTYNDYAKSVKPTSDGGYIVAGNTYSNDGDVTGFHSNRYYDSSDAWIVKLSDTGSIQWQKTLGGSEDDYATSIQPTTDGGYIVAGYTWSNDGDVSGNHGGIDVWIVKLSDVGSIQWQKCLGGAGTDYANSVQQTTDGGYIVAGRTYSSDGDVTGLHGSNADYWIVKLSDTGSIQWQKCLGGYGASSYGADVATSIKQTTDGGFIVAGYTDSNSGDVTGFHGGFGYDAWIVKLSYTGDIQWKETLGGTNSDVASDIQTTTDGGYIMAGYTYPYNQNGTLANYNAWVVKLSNTGIIQWQKTLGGAKKDVANSIQQTTDGGYIIAGSSNDGDVTGYHTNSYYDSYDAWIVKLSVTGTIQWQKCLGGTSDDYAYSIQQTTDGGYIMAGDTYSYNGDVAGFHSNESNNIYMDYWVVKLSADNLAASTPNPVVSNQVLCNGSTVANLTATGSNIQWYFSATGGTALASNTVLTTKSYYVSQTINGIESDRTSVVITINSTLPPTANAQTYNAIATVANLVATGTDLKWYDVATGGSNLDANTELATSTYYVSQTLNSCEGTRTPVSISVIPKVTSPVNYCKGEVTPLSAVGSIGSTLKWYSSAIGGTSQLSVTPITTTVGVKNYYVSQVVNGVESTRASVSVIVNALPTTPGTITGLASQGSLVGTTTTATYSISAVAGATSYLWTIPSGVNIVSGQGTTSVVVNFKDVAEGAGAMGNLMVQAVNNSGCKSATRNLALTKALLTAPTKLIMTNGVTTSAITSFAKYMGTNTVLKLTATSVAAALSYEWELPEGVNRTDALGNTSSVPYIYVNFLGVTSSNTFSYYTTATTPVLTNILRIGVKAKNGTGLSTTANTALVNPTTTSTAKLLTLTAIRPASPANLKMYDLDSATPTTGITDISKYIGTSRELTLIASASVLASSYSWELPTGVNVVSGTDTTSNRIKVNFLNVPGAYSLVSLPATTSLSIGVKAVNGIGSSVKVNAAVPISSATLLTVTAAGPSAAGTIVGSLAICGTNASSVVYSIPTVPKNATFYEIIAPVGATITYNTTTSVSHFGIPADAGLSFTVNYPVNFAATTTKKMVINSWNGYGTSSKILTLTSTSACGTRIASSTKELQSLAKAQVYPNPTSGQFTVELNVATASNVSMTISSLTGSVLSSKNIILTAGKNIINSTISSLTNGVYIITFTNTTTGEVIIKKIVKG